MIPLLQVHVPRRQHEAVRDQEQDDGLGDYGHAMWFGVAARRAVATDRSCRVPRCTRRNRVPAARYDWLSERMIAGVGRR